MLVSEEIVPDDSPLPHPNEMVDDECEAGKVVEETDECEDPKMVEENSPAAANHEGEPDAEIEPADDDAANSTATQDAKDAAEVVAAAAQIEEGEDDHQALEEPVFKTPSPRKLKPQTSAPEVSLQWLNSL